MRAMSSNPARAFGLPVPAIAEGEEANLCLVDVEKEYEIDPAGFYSKSRNTRLRRAQGKGPRADDDRRRPHRA